MNSIAKSWLTALFEHTEHWKMVWFGLLIPLANSHELFRVTHMKHPAHTNDPEWDVDYNTKGTHWWHAALGVHRSYIDQSMPTHVIHRLYPSILHLDEPKATEALKPFMVAQGVRGAADIPERVRFNPLVA